MGIKEKRIKFIGIRLTETILKKIDESLEDGMDRSKFVVYAIKHVLEHGDRPKRFA